MAELMTISEVSQKLKISKWTVYSWISTRYIPFLKLGGRVLFDWIEIEKWLKKNSIEGRSLHRRRIEAKIDGN